VEDYNDYIEDVDDEESQLLGLLYTRMKFIIFLRRIDFIYFILGLVIPSMGSYYLLA
jgi:hypothetical protein